MRTSIDKLIALYRKHENSFDVLMHLPDCPPSYRKLGVPTLMAGLFSLTMKLSLELQGIGVNGEISFSSLKKKNSFKALINLIDGTKINIVNLYSFGHPLYYSIVSLPNKAEAKENSFIIKLHAIDWIMETINRANASNPLELIM